MIANHKRLERSLAVELGLPRAVVDSVGAVRKAPQHGQIDGPSSRVKHCQCLGRIVAVRHEGVGVEASNPNGKQPKQKSANVRDIEVCLERKLGVRAEVRAREGAGEIALK